MPRHRDALPQLMDRPFLTDGGLETDLIFNHGVDLPHMAAYTLLANDAGARGSPAISRTTWRSPAASDGASMLESATWRANADWAARSARRPTPCATLNRARHRPAGGLRDRMPTTPCRWWSAAASAPARTPTARRDHEHRGGRGVPRAADRHLRRHGRRPRHGDDPHQRARGGRHRAGGACRGDAVVISFTVETDGTPADRRAPRRGDRPGGRRHRRSARLLHDQLRPPTHFTGALEEDAAGRRRIRGLRANSSAKSHAELDEADGARRGRPDRPRTTVRRAAQRFPHLAVLGGCCGTDHRHVREIAVACATAR